MEPIPYALKLSQENYDYLFSLGFNRMAYIEEVLKLNTVPEYCLLPSSSGSGDIVVYAMPPLEVINLEEYRGKIFMRMLEE